MSATGAPPVPGTVDELTPAWLTGALRRRHPGITVEDIEVVEVIWGTATKVRIRAHYPGAVEPDGPPEALCVKGGFDKRLRGLGTARAYRLEAGFFEHLAPSLSVPLPGCWFASVDEGERTGVLVLDDLVAAGASFGDPVVPWPVDRVAAALEVAAGWHAATWGLTRERQPWLPEHSIVADLSTLVLDAGHWDGHFSDPLAPLPTGPLVSRERVRAAFGRMWRHHLAGAACLSHGDAHLGNTYLDAAGRPAFLDWQAVCLGPPLDDVAYFISGALAIEDRRAHERELLAHYLAALAANGAPAPTIEAAWLDYRRFCLHGFLWALTPAVMQPWENIRAMAARHIAAILDLDSLGALGD